MSNNISIGKINGNPLNGLCEKVSVEVKTVTDGCMRVYENEQLTLTFSNLSQSPVYPLTFNTLYANGSATISGLVVEPEIDAKSRIRYMASMTVTIYFTDANGTDITANSTLSFYQDVMLSLPQNSTALYEVESAISARSNVGNTVSPNEINVRVCAVVKTRITQRREIVIPTYGDSVYPRCREYEQNCAGISDNPIFTETSNF